VSDPLPVSPPPASAELRLVQEVAGLVLAMAQRLEDGFAAHAAELGLSAAQAKLLLALDPAQALPMRMLAERLPYDPSNLTGVADKLEERGAVQRRPDPRDRRVKGLAITTEGARLRQAFWRRLTGDPGPLGHLTHAQLTRLRDLLAHALDPPGR
jgi:DNA-binding MarR family transcriptional regulator